MSKINNRATFGSGKPNRRRDDKSNFRKHSWDIVILFLCLVILLISDHVKFYKMDKACSITTPQIENNNFKNTP